MKRAVLPLLVGAALFGDGFEGTAALEQAWYDNAVPGKRNGETSGYADVAWRGALGPAAAVLKLEGLKSAEDDERAYVIVNEAEVRAEAWGGLWSAGKSVRFWGSLEGYNVTDVFNTKNLLFAPYSPFEKERKYGSWNLAYALGAGSGEATLIVKFKEEEQPLPEGDSPYYPLPLPYEARLDDAGRPTLYALYGGSAEDMALDYALILQYGYDNHRDLRFDGGVLRQTPVRVRKAMAYATLALDETLLKFEGACASREDGTDYYHVGAGAERSWYGLMAGGDLTLMGEYYKSDVADPAELFDDDVFVGLRYSVNDAASTEASAGVVADTDDGDVIVQGKFVRRLAAAWMLKVLAYAYEAGGPDSKIALLDGHRSVRMALQYRF